MYCLNLKTILVDTVLSASITEDKVIRKMCDCLYPEQGVTKETKTAIKDMMSSLINHSHDEHKLYRAYKKGYAL